MESLDQALAVLDQVARDGPRRRAEREAALAAAAAKSAAAPKPSSGPGPAPAGPSGPPSTAGSVPATAETLEAELRELYRPDQEPVGDYLTRLARVVLALRAYGVNVGQPELEKLTTKATLLAEEFAKIGGDWHPTRMVRGTIFQEFRRCGSFARNKW